MELAGPNPSLGGLGFGFKRYKLTAASSTETKPVWVGEIGEHRAAWIGEAASLGASRQRRQYVRQSSARPGAISQPGQPITPRAATAGAGDPQGVKAKPSDSDSPRSGAGLRLPRSRHLVAIRLLKPISG